MFSSVLISTGLAILQNMEVLCTISMLIWESGVHLCSFEMLDLWTTLAEFSS